MAVWKVTKGKNQCIISSVGIFNEFDFKFKTFVGSRLKYKVTRSNLSSLYNSTGLESYAFCDISSSLVPAIFYFAQFLALVHTVNSAIS